MRPYDLAVIGGGTAGLVGSLTAAGLGASVCLVEQARLGGECLWTGCVPSKGLLAAADLAMRMRTAGRVGLDPVEPKVDLARVLARVRDAQARLEPNDSPERLRAAGVDVLGGTARFLGPGRLVAGDRAVGFRRALLATGSRPHAPPLAGLAAATPLTSETVWDLDTLPDRLLVLGGGPVGCELAQAFARLGARVTLVEVAAGLLAGQEPEAGELLAARLRSEGVEVLLGATPLRVEPGGPGFALVAEQAGAEVRRDLDRVLVATGRRAVTEGLGLDAVGVRTGAAGSVVVDRHLRTTAPGVFAAGDVTGIMPFTHVAAYQANKAVQNALLGLRRVPSYRAVPQVVFTDPEVARVGMTEAEARARVGGRLVVRAFPYRELDRAVAAGDTDGFAKLVADRRGRLLGATVAAPAGGEAIAELAAWIARRGRIDDVARTVHAYPTFAEGPARAASAHLRAKWLGPTARRLARPVLAARRLGWPGG